MHEVLAKVPNASSEPQYGPAGSGRNLHRPSFCSHMASSEKAKTKVRNDRIDGSTRNKVEMGEASTTIRLTHAICQYARLHPFKEKCVFTALYWC